MQTKFLGCFNHVFLVAFSFFCNFLLTNAIDYLYRKKKLDEILCLEYIYFSFIFLHARDQSSFTYGSIMLKLWFLSSKYIFLLM